MIDSEKLISLWKRQNEITKRVASGGLDIDLALARTQDIMDGVYPSKPVFTLPNWYEQTEVQIKTVSEFLKQNGNEVGFTADDIPAPPSDFVPRTPTEVLLLIVPLTDKGRIKNVQRTFDSWWNFTVSPEGCTKWRWNELKSDSKHLHIIIIDGIKNNQKIRWVGFDPETYIGLSPDQALKQALIDGVTLAHYEVLIAAALFSKWVKSWDGRKWHYPNMSAYRFNYNTDWRSAPCLHHWDGDRQLGLSAHRSVLANIHWSSPTIREL